MSAAKSPKSVISANATIIITIDEMTTAGCEYR